jgi:hypothetical protein
MVKLYNIDKRDYTNRDIKNSPIDINKFKDYQKIVMTEKKSESKPGSDNKLIEIKEFKHNSISGEQDSKKGNVFNQNVVINSNLFNLENNDIDNFTHQIMQDLFDKFNNNSYSLEPMLIPSFPDLSDKIRDLNI